MGVFLCQKGRKSRRKSANSQGALKRRDQYECRNGMAGHLYPVELPCAILGVSRAAYHRWLSGKKCARELVNEKVAELVEQICAENPDKVYRWIVERYCGRRFTSRDELISMIENCIIYDNNRCVQRNLGVLTPMEKREYYLMAA